MTTNLRRHAPATARNREPIAEVLARLLTQPATVLEIASGTGEHAAYFGARFPYLTWQPTDFDAESLPSIDAWATEAGVANVRKALQLDASADTWPVEHADAIFSANMIHIAPIEACEGLLRGAARVLPTGGLLILYGPFREGGVHTAPSNEAFDESLRARNPAWGVRNLDDVAATASARGLDQVETVRMPANNLVVVFRKR